MIKNKLKLILASVAVLTALTAVANDCAEHARNAMEVSYCQVKASRYGGSLPSLHRFRKNNEKTQRLILKKPAQKAGVSLPPETIAPVRQPVTIEQSMPVANETRSTPKMTAAQARQGPRRSEPANPLRDCRLRQQPAPNQAARRQIQCAHGTYSLLENRHNTQLAPGVLEEHNRLILPHRQHPDYSAYSNSQYLSKLYQIYLGKMLEIGLAGATMSYTKFVGSYQLHVNNNIDPHQRFSTMFELLKNERKFNSVKARYGEQYPQNIEQCMRVGSSLIVCDDVQNNWVFSK